MSRSVAMVAPVQHLEELAAALRVEGLDAEVDSTKETITVGTARRGPEARPMLITLEGADLEDFLVTIGRTPGSASEGTSTALGLMSTLLIEDVTTVHDRQSNLTTEVYLARGARGVPGLRETRTEPDPLEEMRGGPYAWTVERPGE